MDRAEACLGLIGGGRPSAASDLPTVLVLTAEEIPPAATLLARMPLSVGPVRPARAYDFQSRSLLIAGRPRRLELPHEEYWPRFDEIVCEHLLVYEDDPGRDRDEELLSARLE